MISPTFKLTLTTGLALFAMFFGAGNMIFPLKLGVIAGHHSLVALLGFLIVGVGVPFLGLFAVSLYKGSYWNFFKRLGKTPAFMIVTFLILILGPIFVVPRTEIVTYNTLLPALHGILKNSYIFDLIYFSVILSLVFKQTRVIDIIGCLLSPVKVIAFTVLVALGLHSATPLIKTSLDDTQIFDHALVMGYGTMDLLAAIFFCTVAYKHIVNKCKKIGITSKKSIVKITLISCAIGASLISMIYVGLFLTADAHAHALQNVPAEQLIATISAVVLGKGGSLFVGVCVSFACAATAAALTEVATDFVYNAVLKQKISRTICLLGILVITYLMSILGFDGIMKIASPILSVLYPALIAFCLYSIYKKLIRKRGNRIFITRNQIAKNKDLVSIAA